MVHLSRKVSMWQYAENYWRDLGWSFTRFKGPGEPRTDFRHANRGQDYALVWAKYSKYHPIETRYWFGVDAGWLNNLVNDNFKGWVLFMLQDAGYALVSFDQLLKLLSNARRRKNDQVNVHMQMEGSALKLLPVGTRRWEDITSCFGLRDL